MTVKDSSEKNNRPALSPVVETALTLNQATDEMLTRLAKIWQTTKPEAIEQAVLFSAGLLAQAVQGPGSFCVSADKDGRNKKYFIKEMFQTAPETPPVSITPMAKSVATALTKAPASATDGSVQMSVFFRRATHEALVGFAKNCKTSPLDAIGRAIWATEQIVTDESQGWALTLAQVIVHRTPLSLIPSKSQPSSTIVSPPLTLQ